MVKYSLNGVHFLKEHTGWCLWWSN